MHGFWSSNSVIQTWKFCSKSIYFHALGKARNRHKRSRFHHLWKKQSVTNPTTLLPADFQSNQQWITHIGSPKSRFNIFYSVCLATANCCMSSEINLLPRSLKALFFVTPSVKHCEIRTSGQRSSNRVSLKRCPVISTISALFWNDSTQVQFFLSNWYILLIKKSNLTRRVQRKRNPINRNEFQI